MAVLIKIKFKLGELTGKIFGRKFFWNLEAIFKAKDAILSGYKDDEEFENAGKSEAEFILNLNLIKKEHRVLDIGCGIGRLEKNLVNHAREIHGIDISNMMIKKAQSVFIDLLVLNKCFQIFYWHY